MGKHQCRSKSILPNSVYPEWCLPPGLRAQPLWGGGGVDLDLGLRLEVRCVGLLRFRAWDLRAAGCCVGLLRFRSSANPYLGLGRRWA